MYALDSLFNPVLSVFLYIQPTTWSKRHTCKLNHALQKDKYVHV